MKYIPAAGELAVARRSGIRRALYLLAAGLGCTVAVAQEHRLAASLDLLKQMTLDELMNVEVTSVSMARLTRAPYRSVVIRSSL